MTRRNRAVCAGRLLLIGVGGAGIGGAAFAAPPLLTVKPLRDAGGTLPKANNEPPLNARYAQALRGRIKDEAKQALLVAGIDPESKAETTRYTVEGDLSRADGTSENTGAYLCVLRVYREGKSRRLLLQLAGTANTLRDLSGNLRRDPNVNVNGLAGAFAARIVAALQGGEDENALTDLLGKVDSKRLTAAALTEGESGKQEEAPNLTLKKGAKFRLRVASEDAGAVFLLEIADGKPTSVFAPETPQEIASGKPVILPLDAPLTATNKETREFLVLFRVGKPEIPPLKQAGAAEESPSVQLIVSGGAKSPKALDEGLKRILTRYRQDSAKAWTVLRVRLRFQ